MATWVIENPEFVRWQRISVVQFLCDRERGIRGSGRCFELLMMRNWYSVCDMLITYPYYNFPDLKIDWTDDLWIYDEYNDPWVRRKYQLIHHGILRIFTELTISQASVFVSYMTLKLLQAFIYAWYGGFVTSAEVAPHARLRLPVSGQYLNIAIFGWDGAEKKRKCGNGIKMIREYQRSNEEDE
ncbi:hypothetical protein DMN91_004692 [Ooceraea biroi]|uniref:Uncharacterized protein n=1 Tax=Ooceraea biroi TaxID=2015173 RepID=A0A3L8DPR1_OOCBI|nr:hypothetical protein DMN91_004692 [Ooceraea biroi]